MPKTRRLIFETPIEGIPNATVMAELHYSKDRVRGYYFSAIVNRTEDGYITWIPGEQSKHHLIEQAKRFNQREFDLMQVSEELQAQVKQEAIDSIRKFRK